MMRRLCIYGLLAVSLSYLSGCIEAVELKEETPTEKEFVVHAVLYAGTGRNVVELGFTQEFGIVIPAPEEGANVSVTDEQGNTYSFTEESSGTYIWENTTRPILAGEAFTLNISTRSGEAFTSTPETVPGGVPIKNIYYEVNQDQFINEIGNPLTKDFVDVYIDVDLTGAETASLLRWETDNVYLFWEVDKPKPPCNPFYTPKVCYIYDGKMQPEEVLLLDGRENVNTEINRIWVGRKQLDSTFNQLNGFEVVQHSMTKSSFAYWEDVNKVISQGGGIFDSPPAPVRGNITNVDNPLEQVLGSFQVANTDTAHLLIYKTDLAPEYVPPRYCKPLWWDPCTFYRPCDNCQVIKNSSPVRPAFFP
ncbi:MAG: DUF4249 domain-containing protein [Bacteroidota bacterium]